MSLLPATSRDETWPDAPGVFDWAGRRVTVMGLGRHGGGVAAVRYLAERGARVTISDVAARATLDEPLAQLEGLPIAALKFGAHDPADFRADTVVVNPAVRPAHACLEVARAWGASLTSEIELFLARCPARVIGVTGTNGKSTTSSMLHAILTASGRRAWLGGNIGHSLLGDVERMAGDDWVVLEMSSFQLAHLSPQSRLPEMAVVTNCAPNHLDWHGSYEHYVAAKRRLIEPMPDSAGGTRSTPHTVVLNAQDGEVTTWHDLVLGRSIDSWPLEAVPRLFVPGEHNRHNAACAAAAAEAAGVERATIVAALGGFRGLPHRLELVGQVSRRRFYNDSKSTSPQAAIAALAAVEGRVWLLAGGLPKGADYRELARCVVGRARGAALFGAASRTLQSQIKTAAGSFDAAACHDLREAFDWCWKRSQPGDAILLSPASASYDQFCDYRQRGEAFRALVEILDRTGTT